MRLKDKVAVITGASAGAGQGIAELFVKEGAKVVVVARREGRLQALPSAVAPLAVYGRWANDVRTNVYPQEQNGWHMDAAELEKFNEAVEKF